MNSKYRGICCIVFSAFCFSLMSVFIRLAGDLPSMQKSLFRNLVAVFFAIGIMKKQKVGFSGDKKNLGLLVIRSMFGTMGILCNYYAVDHLVLADASMLNKMAPFFTLLFSFILLREKISLVQGLAVAGAFLGSLLILRPTGFDLTRLPAFVGLLGGMGAGVCASARNEGREGTVYRLFLFRLLGADSAPVCDYGLSPDAVVATWQSASGRTCGDRGAVWSDDGILLCAGARDLGL